MDIIVAAGVLLLLSPVILVVAAAVRWKMGSPVLFRHPRPGYRERVFLCLKFRSMTDARDASGRLLSDAERLPAFGRTLRRLSLDELPQLWNVLRGEMSLVGPRPLEVRYLPRYSPEQRRRHDAPPGITGWAQIHGRNALDWERRLELDVWYVDHRGIRLDLEILFRTVLTVVRGNGISQVGHATAPEFLGTPRA